MKTCFSLLFAGMLLAGLGCDKTPDPRDRPGFIDTSDPGKVAGTMTPPPGKTKDPTALTGGPRTGKPPGVK
jgi:hypothetical protein